MVKSKPKSKKQILRLILLRFEEVFFKKNSNGGGESDIYKL